MPGARIVISAAVEGIADKAVVRRLVTHVGAQAGTICSGNGKAKLFENIKGYSEAARRRPWIVPVDLDQDAECTPPLRVNSLPSVAPLMCFRIAVRAAEAWLMADRESPASFPGSSAGIIPPLSGAIADPKQMTVNMARRSRRRVIRLDMAPRAECGRQVGPAYPSRLIDFVEDRQNGRRPNAAAESCGSLGKCLKCLKRLVDLCANPAASAS